VFSIHEYSNRIDKLFENVVEDLQKEILEIVKARVAELKRFSVIICSIIINETTQLKFLSV
jgi:hypothetical protein